MSTDLVIDTFKDFRIPSNLRFGVNAFYSLNEEIQGLGCKKIAVISDKGLEKAGLVQKVLDLIGDLQIPIVTFTDIEGEPTFDIVRKATEFVRISSCDLVIGIGGGSALDVAKTSAALADKEDIEPYLSGEARVKSRSVRCILLPTTSGTGSEVTMNAIFGDTEKQMKRGIVSECFLPDVAVIDPALTVSCPPRVTAASGVDAFTHAIESYISVNSTPLTRMYAEKAMTLFAPSIVRAVHHGSDIEARTNMSWVSVLAGVSLANAGVGAVHALAYPLGGTFHIEHGVANALLMPYVFEVIGTTCIPQMVEVAQILNLGEFNHHPEQALPAVTEYLFYLLEVLDLPMSLKELGIKEDDLASMALQAVKIDRLLKNTPYRLNEKKIYDIYHNSLVGK